MEHPKAEASDEMKNRPGKSPALLLPENLIRFQRNRRPIVIGDRSRCEVARITSAID